jgi:hypothetical protein
MLRLSKVLERTRRELIAATDPSFIHHKQYYKELPSKNISGSVYRELQKVGTGKSQRWEVVFDTPSARHPSESYEQRVALLDLAPLLRDKKSKLNFKDKVLYAINNGDLQINCTCPAHLFWGYKYINTKLGTNIPGQAENRAPDIRNPQRRGDMCKHLNLVCSVLPANAMSITHDLKGALGEAARGVGRLMVLVAAGEGGWKGSGSLGALLY